MDRLLTFLLVLVFTSSFFSAVQPTEFTIINRCRSTIWPGIRTTGGTPLTPTGFILKSNESRTLSVANPWMGAVWGRTDCSTDTSTGNFSCLTGDCGNGKLDCAGTRIMPPATVAELYLNAAPLSEFYDVSLVDGFNLPMLVVAKGGKSGGCGSAGCPADLNAACPRELRVERTNGSRRETVGCKSACNAFGTQVHCCSAVETAECQPTLYSLFFKNACPQAYSYAMDKNSTYFSCSSADYSIIFCPSSNTSPAPGATAFVPNPRKPSGNWMKYFLLAIATILVLLTIAGLFWRQQRKNGCLQVLSRLNGVQSRKLTEKANDDSLFYSFATIEIATNHFSDENILGRGGYGPVYKGKLLDGQEIAVKRLQKMSGHGIEQFKNEVTVISNLQHRNLVRLLGYCTDNNERILIYEYLPKKSLDSILFGDAETRAVLGWKSRLQIIEGIAEGLLYLHKYSRLKIIHRDLKTSNILLDNDLSPKISDFGTAKIFGDGELCANTNRIVGTYGYMSPEYAMDGIFSVKSDVFSFGVMMLEIISGKKNTAFYNSDRHINLLGYVWDLWIEERVLEIIDPNLLETISIGEVVRYVQVGLLCVQENAGERPTMSVVVSMLQNESMSLPAPKQPSFTAILNLTNSNPCETLEPASLNMVTISVVGGR